MKIALVCCPAWGTCNPPLSIATLQMVLKRDKYEVIPFDFNIRFYKAHKVKHGILKALFWYYNKKYYRLFSILDLINEREYNRYIQEILSSGADVICFTTYKPNGLTSAFFAKKIKDAAPRKKVIFGGPFVSDKDERVRLIQSKITDAIILGEGEKAILKVLKSINKKKWKNKCQIIEATESEPVDLNKEPIPDFSGMSFDDYETKQVPYALSRGCPNRCTFCFESVFWKSFRYKSGKKVFNDIKQLTKIYKLKGISFTGSTINGNRKELERMCDLIIKSRLNVVWYGQARCIDLDEKFLRKMKKAGCFYLMYGIESGSQRVLNLMKKGCDIREMEHIVRMTNATGIKVQTNFMAGYPGETWSDFYETVKFLWRNRHAITIVLSSPAFLAKEAGLGNHGSSATTTRKNNIFWRSKGTSPLNRFIRWIILEALVMVLVGNGCKKLNEYHNSLLGATTTNHAQ